MSARQCCCGSDSCCAPGRIYQFPADMRAAPSTLEVDHDTSVSWRHTVATEGEATQIVSYSRTFGGTVSSGATALGPKGCDGFVVTDSDASSGVVGTDPDGDDIHEVIDLDLTVRVDPKLASVEGPGFLDAGLYTWATGFFGHLVSIDIGAAFSRFVRTTDPLVDFGDYTADRAFFELGYPCAGLPGFAGVVTEEAPDLISSSSQIEGHEFTNPGNQNSVATPFAVVHGVVPTRMLGNKTFSWTDASGDYIEISTEMSHTRADQDSIGTIHVKRTIIRRRVAELAGGEMSRTTDVWSIESDLTLTMRDADTDAHTAMERCSGYTAQVAAYCAGTTPSDCCVESSLPCSKADDGQDIVYRTTMMPTQAIKLALAGDVDDPDVTEAVQNLAIPGITDGLVTAPGANTVVRVGTEVNESDPCKPPPGPHTASERESPLTGYDAAGFFTVLGRELLQVIGDATPDGRRVEMQWNWQSDLVKRRGVVSGYPGTSRLVANIRFIYDKTSGTGSFNPGGSSLAVFGVLDGSWATSVGFALTHTGDDGPCLSYLRVGSGAISSGVTLTRLDMSTVPRLVVHFDALLETLNLAECAPAASPVVMPTPEQSKALASERRESERAKKAGDDCCGGFRDV